MCHGGSDHPAADPLHRRRVRIHVHNGCLTYLHDDAVDSLLAALGPVMSSQRASHVESDPQNLEAWVVDLSPVGGPYCRQDEQGKPFVSRQAALDFERRWLESRLGQIRSRLQQDQDYAGLLASSPT